MRNRGAHVPFHHQYLLAQFIKGLLAFGPNKEFVDFSDFNFSGLKGQTKVSRKGLHYYSSKVTLVFACSHKEFLDYFIAQVFSQKDIMVGNLHLNPESVEKEEPVSVAEETRFLCISPIVIINARFNDDNAKKFIHPESDEFSDLLYECTIARMERSGKYSPEQLTSFYKFQIVPDKAYLQRIQESNKKFARIYPLYDNDIKFEVRGYTFPFTLYAAREVQEFIFEHGLGYFAHKGFGMLDLAVNDPAHKPPREEVSYA